MNWIKKIEESENINQLPLYDELNRIAEDEEIDLYGEWDSKKIIIKDGTIIELEKDHKCFVNRRNEWIFYHIEDTDLFICAECGLWQKSCSKLKKEVGYIEDMDELLLPYDWNENGVKAYLMKRIEKQDEYEKKDEQRRLARKERERMQYSGVECCCCVHMINNECECGIYEYDEDECDFKARGH